MGQGDDAVLGYLDHVIEELAARGDAALEPFLAKLRGIKRKGARRGPYPGLDHPTMNYLDMLLTEASDTDAEAARALDWMQIYVGGSMDPSLAEGMLAAQLAGTYGRIPSEEVSIGQFLIAPHVTYPLHTHEAPEVYFCRAGSIEVQHGLDGTAMTLKAGDYSVTPSHRLHALRTGDAPVLIAYVWIGDLRCRNWWWAQDAAGAWQRTAWKRGEGNAWRVLEAEPVSPEIFAEAHRGL